MSAWWTRALDFEEVRLAREPEKVIPHLAGRFTLWDGGDNGAKHSGASIIVKDDCGNSERTEPLHDLVMLVEDLFARRVVGQGLSFKRPI